MKYVVGMDGGGTKVQLCAADVDGKRLLEEVGGGTNLCSAPEAQVAETLRILLEKTMHSLGGPPQAVCIGSAGVVDGSHRTTLKALITRVTGAVPVVVLNDSQIALRANLEGHAGISITAGTGTICLAQDEQGNTVRLSGWGHTFSDEGSAYDIVRRSLAQVCMSHDQRIPPTAMTELFLTATNSRDFDEMITTLYTSYQPKERLASLAHLTQGAADMGDPSAKQVLKDAATQLFAICRCAAQRLYAPQTAFHVIENGGVFRNSQTVRLEFETQMKAAFPNCTLAFGGREAVWGAVQYALEAANGERSYEFLTGQAAPSPVQGCFAEANPMEQSKSMEGRMKSVCV